MSEIDSDLVSAFDMMVDEDCVLPMSPEGEHIRLRVRRALQCLEKARRLPKQWREKMRSGHGDYGIATRKAAFQCADELDRAIAQEESDG